ncbi:hypothetical protein AQS8620_00362 [Aquimixticola soesokkakensis]|uniref:Uncharacterized protein n=1 Tax=Aquimixticola soesokkakensis TaxID=1519096 RepID=A0A1Y5RGQ6_9RHOB|nr:hypothetical protein [Aquimixticola soesokkakensis]SLN17058.1 hypothetical protein AQS8620_00362 [Aquimixticola soesokkakensis]
MFGLAGLAALPRAVMRAFIGLCIWLMFRPGGWAVVCVLVLVAVKLVPRS